MHRRVFKRVFCLLGVILAQAAVCIKVQADTSGVSKEADAWIRKLADFYRGTGNFSAHVHSVIKTTMQGLDQEIASTYRYAVKRPNQFSVVLQDGGKGVGGTLVSDGTRVYTHIPMLQRYTVRDAPASMDALLDDMGVQMVAGYLPLCASIAQNDPYGEIMDGVRDGKYLGREKIGDADTHHLRFSQSDMDWEIWIQDGERPVMRRVLLDIAQRNAMGEVTIQMTVDYDQWTVDTNLPEQAFAFTPPQGAEKVESLLEGFGGGREKHALLGKPAPDFSLETLDGGTVSLSSHKDREIVILDFWATWCGPCVQALPILVEVAGSFRDKGVAFYAVNLQEDAARIRKFQKEENLRFPVILDRDGAVGDLYQAQAIPQTVVVGKTGTVEVVHVGLSTDLKKRLTRELNDLIAGDTPAR